MPNGFSKEVYNMWDTLSPDSGRWYECFGCGRSHADCLHHNFGRGGSKNEGGKPFNSFLNSVPLNNELCHLPRHGANKRNRRWLQRTHEAFGCLVRQYGYSPTRKDEEFFRIHQEAYKEINITKLL